MRLEPIPPDDLPPEVSGMYRQMQDVIAGHLNNFVTQRPDGALVGPFPPLLHFPHFGAPAWELIRRLIASSTLPASVREVVILSTGARYDSRYEIYSHERSARKSTLSAEKIATLSAGERPTDLSEQEAAAFDVTAALLRGNQLPQSTYDRALRSFEPQQLAEIVYLISGYVLISLLLNAYDISVPGREDGLLTG
ncbi:carboxymuconolactone decarboxylase family protein [Sphingomonas sp.]|uniref:carboxymuconolactone decarboxylase family protein n=1 Tax=Sphingomonas sp. TaxID=28214 RepID=UPI003B3B2E7B